MASSASSEQVHEEFGSIPIIDLSLPDSINSALLRDAVSRVGFFYLINHGVKDESCERCFESFHSFFALPTEQKARRHGCDGLRWDEGAREKWGGYLAPGLSTLDPNNQTVPDQKESWSMTRELGSSHPEVQRWPSLQGPNAWPDPSLLPSFRESVTQYFSEVSDLGPRIMRLIALAFELPEDHFTAEGLFDEALVTLGANHYSERDSEPEEGVLGIGAHTDYGALTFLLTDEVPGLQISPPGCHERATDKVGLRAAGSISRMWLDVPPQEGA